MQVGFFQEVVSVPGDDPRVQRRAVARELEGHHHAGAAQRWPKLSLPSVPVPGAVAYLAAAPRGPDYAGYSSGFDNDAYPSAEDFTIVINWGDTLTDEVHASSVSWVTGAAAACAGALKRVQRGVVRWRG